MFDNLNNTQMDLLFRIYYFASMADLAKEVTERLNSYEGRADSVLIGEGNPFSISRIEKSSALSILLINNNEAGSIVRLHDQEISSPQANSTLLVCVDMNESDAEKLKFPNYVLVKSSAEQIRMEVKDFYRRVKNKNSFSSFVGRTQEVEQFQSLLYSENSFTTKAVIVSGHKGVGREAFVRECIRLASRGEINEPCIISMGDNGSIEFFLVQLNAFLKEYEENHLRGLLSDEKEIKVVVTASLLNKMFSAGKYLIVYDDARSCIRYDRRFADWFNEVISSPSLKVCMHLFVISTVTVHFTKTKVIDNAAFFNLYDLSRSDRKKLIYRLLDDQEAFAIDDDVNFILDSSIYSPRLLLRVVDDYIHRGHIKYIKSKMGDYLSISDSGIRSVITKYKNEKEPDLWNVLVLLSKIEYLSSGVLGKIFKDSYDLTQKYLDSFISEGLVERSGAIDKQNKDEYYRLESSVRDYLQRNKYTYNDSSFKGHVEEVMSDLIADNPSITEDYSVYLYKVKMDLLRGRKSTDSLMIPSIVVTSIIEAYNNRNYEDTISLCDWVLEEKTHYFNDVYREIRYWRCLALARLLRKDEFYKSVDSFKNDADYFFLLGFMNRMEKDYFKAETEYRKALQKNPSLGRAKRELVIALQGQHKFREALELAKENYERDRENSYHLLAYYRCLVRKHNTSYEERQVLDRLLEEAKGRFGKNYYKAMLFEYDRFVRKKPIIELKKEAEELGKIGTNNKSSLLVDVSNDFNVAQGFGSTIKTTALDNEFDR